MSTHGNDIMTPLDGMELCDGDIRELVTGHVNSYDPLAYTADDVCAALGRDSCGIEGLKALLSPAADAFTEQTARRAASLTAQYFGNSVSLFTPLYISNYCENRCVYCSFNCKSPIPRMKLDSTQLERELEAIASTGMEEILILTGESPSKSPLDYIGDACRTARRYFRSVAVEIYPVNTDAYRYLHECGADFVTVFQETYDTERYSLLHPAGRKRIWTYRFDAQERALLGGMRGVSFGALFGLSDFRHDALAAALHLYFLRKKYPHAECSLSCPRLRPASGCDSFDAQEISERELCRVLCAWRIFLPYVGITVSSRESSRFRNGIVKIAATKVSAGVSTGVGAHTDKGDSAGEYSREYEHGGEQFEICDTRTLRDMCRDIEDACLQPILNDFIYM